MLPLLRALPPLVLVAAAVDTLLVRLDHPWRPTEATLYLQALALWALFFAAALVPAALTRRLLTRRRGQDDERAPSAWGLLALWGLGPVAAHHVLDRYSGVEGSLSALAAVRPWVELIGVLVGLGLVLGLFERSLTRLGRRRTVSAAVVIAVAVGLALPWRAFPGAPAGAVGASASRPNVLLLVWDTCRSDRLETYGYARPTSPGLAALAQDAIVFEDSVSASVFTFTSHLSMLTGLHPSSHGARLVNTRYDPRKGQSVVAAFRDAGYRTGGFVGTDVLAGRTGIRYGFEVYDDQVDPPVCDTHAWKLVHDVQTILARSIRALRNDGRPHWIQDFQRPADDVLARALAWIGNDDPRPWFCFVNLYDVHWPYLPAPDAARELVRPYDGALDGFLFRSDEWEKGRAIEDADRRHVAELYEAEILELDRKVEAFFAALELERGTTAFLLTADHGEAFGEQGRWKHEDVTEPQVRVPFVLHPPGGVPGGRRTTAPVSGVDVGPTLLGLAGLEPPAGMQGLDLASEEAAADRTVLVEDRDHVDPTDVNIALYRGGWKLVRRGLGDEARWELYRLEHDPLAERDVKGEHPELFQELVTLLEERRAAFDTAEAQAAADLGEQGDALRALGYGGEG